ncbi:MAG: hypothetical protein DMF82_08160 [Acidobacteria bacterium]|nr:MAG: hypothetical protein DMF82_08160 [Acidobacteriota bacterium]
MRRTWSDILPMVLVLTLAFALAHAGLAAESKSAADRVAIDKGHETFMVAMRASDCTGLLRVVADDAVFVPPNAPNAVGKEGIRSWCQGAFSQARTSAVSVSDRQVTVTGDWGIEHGKFDWTLAPVAGGNSVRDQGNFLAIWHRPPDGSWKVTRDIWNSSLPLPGAR